MSTEVSINVYGINQALSHRKQQKTTYLEMRIPKKLEGRLCKLVSKEIKEWEKVQAKKAKHKKAL